jgi:hypothetical protein
MSNTSLVNGSEVDGSGESYFEGIIVEFQQSIGVENTLDRIISFEQSVGIVRYENIFTVIDQTVLLRSVNESGDLVCFYQDVQKTVDEQNIVTLNQKVMP